MHREIIKVRDDRVVDHKNHDTADNTKANLREATYTQNSTNARKSHSKTTSRYKGVSLKKDRCRRPWQAGINTNGKKLHLDYFASEVQAAKAYDRAAKRHHGPYACLNFTSRRPSIKSRVLSVVRTVAAVFILRYPIQTTRHPRCPQPTPAISAPLVIPASFVAAAPLTQPPPPPYSGAYG